MKLATTPEEQRRWMEQWRAAAAALEEARIAELSGLTEEEAWRKAERLLELAPSYRRETQAEGLVEQQTSFAKGRRS